MQSLTIETAPYERDLKSALIGAVGSHPIVFPRRRVPWRLSEVEHSDASSGLPIAETGVTRWPSRTPPLEHGRLTGGLLPSPPSTAGPRGGERCGQAVTGSRQRHKRRASAQVPWPRGFVKGLAFGVSQAPNGACKFGGRPYDRSGTIPSPICQSEQRAPCGRASRCHHGRRGKKSR